MGEIHRLKTKCFGQPLYLRGSKVDAELADEIIKNLIKKDLKNLMTRDSYEQRFGKEV